MAAKTQPEKPLDETTKNRKVDRSKPSDANLASSKDGSPSDATSCISSGDAAGSIKEGDLDRESLVAEHGMYYPAGSYYGYYYPGYDGSLGEWDDQGYFIGSDGLEVQYPAIQADNGSLIYYTPVLQPGFVPYGSYLPGATVGIDGQYLGQQPYFPSPVFPQSIPSPGYFPNPVPFGSEVVSSYFWDPSLLVGDAGNGNGYGVPTITGSKPNLSSPAHNLASVSPKTLSTKTNNQAEIKASTPPLDVTSGAGVLNQLKPTNKVATALPKGYFPLAKFQGKSGLLYPNTPINFKANGRGWSGTEKLKSKTSGISDFDWLNEQNRGPRTNSTKVPVLEVDISGTLTPDGNNHLNITAPVVRREQYNLPDFPTKYDHALFFVIKSYSEDDIHKSIKYNVWASTPNGNKRLDGAYLDAQERMREKGNKCPVFLFFSVNASGQFCGVAEMIGRVDFNKNMDFWQQDKWNGYFPVKWHIIKDVPNPQFRHIILENNDNKPVTNSRDTQEVKFAQGIEMLNIFKNYSSKTSILDDFAFYESRQKAMQDKRIRPSTPRLDHVQKAGDITQVITGLQSIDLNAAKKSNEEVAVGDKAKD